MNETPELLTVAEVAALLRTTRAAVYHLIERRTLPGIVKVGARVLFRAADLRAHLGLEPIANDATKEDPVVSRRTG